MKLKNMYQTGKKALALETKISQLADNNARNVVLIALALQGLGNMASNVDCQLEGQIKLYSEQLKSLPKPTNTLERIAYFLGQNF